jgi:REP element-mobilizing transposase RayT
MSRKYKISDQEELYFVSFATVNWIDLFTRQEYNEILLSSLRYCQVEKGLEVYAWCIMTNHLHFIIGTNDKPLQNILRDFKSFTSSQLKNEINNNPVESRKEWIKWMFERAGLKNSNNNNWQLWQQNNHPIELNTNKLIDQKLQYIHENPVKAGFVAEPHHWKYSSAIDYCGGKGLLNIHYID